MKRVHRPPRFVPAVVTQKAVLHGASALARRASECRRGARVDVGSGRGARSLTGGSEAFLAEVVTRDGAEAVIKIQYPGGPAFPTTVRSLEAAQGDAYAGLLAHAVQRRALLLERLGPSLAERGFRFICSYALCLVSSTSSPKRADQRRGCRRGVRRVRPGGQVWLGGSCGEEGGGRGKHRFPPPKRLSGRWDGHSRGKNWGGLGTQVFVGTGVCLVPRKGESQNP